MRPPRSAPAKPAGNQAARRGAFIFWPPSTVLVRALEKIAGPVANLGVLLTSTERHRPGNGFRPAGSHMLCPDIDFFPIYCVSCLALRAQKRLRRRGAKKRTAVLSSNSQNPRTWRWAFHSALTNKVSGGQKMVYQPSLPTHEKWQAIQLSTKSIVREQIVRWREHQRRNKKAQPISARPRQTDRRNWVIGGKNNWKEHPDCIPCDRPCANCVDPGARKCERRKPRSAIGSLPNWNKLAYGGGGSLLGQARPDQQPGRKRP